MTDADLVLQQHGSVLEIRLDRPRRRNALSRSVLHSLRQAAEALPTDVSAVVLTASGPVFSAGADFAELTGTPADLDYDSDLAATSAAFRRCPVPVVAAVAGPCIGAGVELAISCDARVVGPESSFRVPAVELGLLYNPDSIRRLHAVLPRNTVWRMMAFAEDFAGEEALTAGIATHVAESDACERALAIARSFAALPAASMNATRRLLTELDEGSYDEDFWQATRDELLSSPTRQRAVADARAKHLHRDRGDPTQN